MLSLASNEGSSTKNPIYYELHTQQVMGLNPRKTLMMKGKASDPNSLLYANKIDEKANSMGPRRE